MVKQTTKDRRFWIRAKRVLSIQYRLVQSRRKSYDHSWHLSTTQDMSYGGLSFYSDLEFRKNEILELHVVMSGILDIFNGFGKVTRVEQKKTGSYFLIGVKFNEEQKKKRNAKTFDPTQKRPARKKTRKRVWINPIWYNWLSIL